MPADAFIDETIRRRIERELDAIERDHDVRILLAVESGSRAWRFPSQDSDYDVRFVYVHRVETYLSIEPPRDVIERPVNGLLDINGWDLRKTLRLLVRSNAPLVEWLHSPVRYREVETASIAMRSMARRTCFLPALIYHYDRMARRCFDQILACGDAASLKTYCYAVRSSLALLWIRQYSEAPPMDLPALLSNSVVANDVRTTITEVVNRKVVMTEQGSTPRIPILDVFIGNILTEIPERSRPPDRAAAVSEANSLFISIVRADLLDSPSGTLG